MRKEIPFWEKSNLTIEEGQRISVLALGNFANWHLEHIRFKEG